MTVKAKDIIPEQHSQAVNELLSKYQGTSPGALIPVLQKTQDIIGYLPKDAMIRIADTLNTSLSKVYGVATFYSQFHIKPRGKHIIRVCQGTACHVLGSDKVMNGFKQHLNTTPGETTEDGEFTLESVACIGACALAPVIVVDEKSHGKMSAENIGRLLDGYKNQSTDNLGETTHGIGDVVNEAQNK